MFYCEGDVLVCCCCQWLTINSADDLEIQMKMLISLDWIVFSGRLYS